MSEHYSTSDVRVPDRADYWHELVGHTYAPCLEHVAHPNAFSAQLTTQAFGRMEVSEVTSSPISYRRTDENIHRAPRDELFLSLMLEGTGWLEQNGRSGVQNCGDVLLYESGHPYAYVYDQPYRAELIRIPRPLATARLPQTDQLGGMILSGQSPFGRLLASLVRETITLARTAKREKAAAFSPAMLDMLATAIRHATGDIPDGTEKSVGKLHLVQQYLRENLADSELSLHQIAKDQGLSLRSLCRLFAGAGTTPMAWLQNARLQAAYSALAEHRVASVTEAAMAFGFRSLSHFSRSFRKTFAASPKTVLYGDD